MDPRKRDDRFFNYGLLAVLFGGLVLRLLYLYAQPGADPTFARPMIDGAYYLEWARSLAAGTAGPSGAYYLAPLYPAVLAVFLRVCGENFVLLYLGQQLLTLVTAGLLAIIARRCAGPFAGLATAVLAVLYHPGMFFAAAPLGETLGLLLLVLGLLIGSTPSRKVAAPAAGLLTGLAALARPNLLLVPLLWMGADLFKSRYRSALLLVVGLAVVITPVLIRNRVVSGELVPISSNSGITAFHGNGPGAGGIFKRPHGFSGALERQREEATRLARRQSGMQLNDVEADRWWGEQAIQTRLAEPWDSIKLFAYKTALLVDNHEHGLDYSPALDRNPWRPLAVVPFALLFGLAVGGLAQLGVVGSGGGKLWWALLGCALTPVLFYISSRYRLPVSMLLTVPAGCGLAAFAGRRHCERYWSRAAALVLAGGCLAVSLMIPSSAVREIELATGLTNRAVAFLEDDRPDQALVDAQLAIGINPGSAHVQFNYGVVLEARGDLGEAEQAYRVAWMLDPTLIDAAGNLAVLMVTSGRAAEAIPVLEAALAQDSSSLVCWTNLVIAYAEAGDLAKAGETIDATRSRGLQLAPGLVEAVRAAIDAQHEDVLESTE